MGVGAPGPLSTPAPLFRLSWASSVLHQLSAGLHSSSGEQCGSRPWNLFFSVVVPRWRWLNSPSESFSSYCLSITFGSSLYSSSPHPCSSFHWQEAEFKHSALRAAVFIAISLQLLWDLSKKRGEIWGTALSMSFRNSSLSSARLPRTGNSGLGATLPSKKGLVFQQAQKWWVFLLAWVRPLSLCGGLRLYKLSFPPEIC